MGYLVSKKSVPMDTFKLLILQRRETCFSDKDNSLEILYSIERNSVLLLKFYKMFLP